VPPVMSTTLPCRDMRNSSCVSAILLRRERAKRGQRRTGMSSRTPVTTVVLGTRLGVMYGLSTLDSSNRNVCSASARQRLQVGGTAKAIGLTAVASLDAPLDAELRSSISLRDPIESFWLEPEHRRTRVWKEHADINDVMLATALAPEGFLRFPSRRASART
jgi:hypothetical protein